MRNVIIIGLGIGIGLFLRWFLHEKPAEHAPEAVAAVTAVEPVKPPEPPINPAYVEPVLYVKGYIARGDRANVVLSDGTTWTEQSQGMLQIYRHYVKFRGKSYPIRIVAREVAPPSASSIPSNPMPEVRAPEARSLLLDTTAADLDAAARKK